MSAAAIHHSAATYDEADLLDRLDGDTELLVELAQTFVDAHTGQLAELRRAFDAGDLPAVSRQAHALKGGLLTLSAHAATHAVSLEAAAKTGQADASARSVRALEDELPKLAHDLTAAIARFTA